MKKIFFKKKGSEMNSLIKQLFSWPRRRAGIPTENNRGMNVEMVDCVQWEGVQLSSCAAYAYTKDRNTFAGAIPCRRWKTMQKGWSSFEKPWGLIHQGARALPAGYSSDGRKEKQMASAQFVSVVGLLLFLFCFSRNSAVA